MAVNPDGTFDVQYTDGKRELRVGRDQIKPSGFTAGLGSTFGTCSAVGCRMVSGGGCPEPHGVGQACTTNQQCRDGLECDGQHVCFVVQSGKPLGSRGEMCKFQRDCMDLLTCDEKNGRCCSEKKGQPEAGRGVCHSACGCNRDCKDGFFCHTNEFTCVPLTKSGQERPLTACPAVVNSTGSSSKSGSGSGSGKGSGSGGGSNHVCCCDPLIPCGNPNDCLDDCVPSGSEGNRWHMGNYTWKFIPAPTSGESSSAPSVPFKKTNNPDCNVGCMAEARGEAEKCSRDLQTATTHGTMDKARHCMDQAMRKVNGFISYILVYIYHVLLYDNTGWTRPCARRDGTREEKAYILCVCCGCCVCCMLVYSVANTNIAFFPPPPPSS